MIPRKKWAVTEPVALCPSPGFSSSRRGGRSLNVVRLPCVYFAPVPCMVCIIWTAQTFASFIGIFLKIIYISGFIYLFEKAELRVGETRREVFCPPVYFSDGLRAGAEAGAGVWNAVSPSGGLTTVPNTCQVPNGCGKLQKKGKLLRHLNIRSKSRFHVH